MAEKATKKERKIIKPLYSVIYINSLMISWNKKMQVKSTKKLIQVIRKYNYKKKRKVH